MVCLAECFLFYRATWHPLVDVAVAGRYPDEKFPDYVPGELRTIDLIDVDSGKDLFRLHEPGINKISSLNQVSTARTMFSSSAFCSVRAHYQ